MIKIGNYKLRKIIPYIIINLTFIYCVQVKAYVDKKKCSVDDIINYKIELQDASSFGDISINKLSGHFSIISGPSQQTSMQWINGSVTNSKTISWTLAPKKTGKIKIPSLDVRIGGQTYKTNQITLQVVGSNKKNIYNIWTRTSSRNFFKFNTRYAHFLYFIYIYIYVLLRTFFSILHSSF